MFQAPIPGESLTREPGAAAYEQPPKLNTPEEALSAYMDRFDDDDKREAIFTILEQGTPISVLTALLVREGVRNGIHSVDLGVILKPMVHEYISVLAEAAGIQADDSPADKIKPKALEKRHRQMIASEVERQLSMSMDEEDNLEMANLPQEPEEIVPDEVEITQTQGPRGLMQRPNMQETM